MKTTIEICCGSYEDALAAFQGGCDRIELNSALYLGGLTPSLATLQKVKQAMDIPVVCMVRPRGAGFYYSEIDYEIMLADCKILLDHGADGIAFGFLNKDKTIDLQRTKEMIQLIKAYDKEVVFHRAFDCVEDKDQAMKDLIVLGVDRVLTSGLEETAILGIETITYLQKNYGNQIQILPGSGIKYHNAKEFIKQTNVVQIHSSCKGYKIDETTTNHHVTYSYDKQDAYEVVIQDEVEKLCANINN